MPFITKRLTTQYIHLWTLSCLKCVDKRMLDIDRLITCHRIVLVGGFVVW